ncbi:MAG: trehalose-phosphatase [Phycisphaerae bacterium]
MDLALTRRLDELARTPILLVATDFDGTIAPIVSDPAAAEADREAAVALKALTAMPQTHVAIISGRALSDLASRTLGLDQAHRVGSHGSEFEAGLVTPLTPEAIALHERLAVCLRDLAAQHAGVAVEEKPAAFALHYRNASPEAADAAVAALASGAATWPGVFVRHGRSVVELSVIETNKGAALDRIRQRVGATAAIFMGDDATDEDAFATLAGPDVGIKIGPGESRAAFRHAGVAEVARTLARLAEVRAAWLAGSHATPIEQHSLLSDQRTTALVDPRARVVWMCLPRIDSSALFAELLGGPAAGYFEIAPAAAATPAPVQRYVSDSFVLETQWPTLRVTDYLDCGGGRAFQRAGRTDLVRVLEGSGRVRITFAPRLDFGRIETVLSISDRGILIEGAVDSIVLCSPPLPWQLVGEGRHQSAVAEFELPAVPITLEMRYGTASMDASPRTEHSRREQTQRFWTCWADTLRPPHTAQAAVIRSALLLKALCYGPTGAIAAAATTSLPEHVGGVRNWDYRFCWPRDAALAASSLVRLGAPGPGLKLLDWLLGIVDQCEAGALLCPLYTVTGGSVGAEGEIAELAGYRGSRPVRVGNAASRQVQLDVFGPIAELIVLLAESGAALSAEHWRLVDTIVSAVEQRWREPDHGIWEVRRPRQHHVHSKVMCWQAIDRAIRIAHSFGRKRPDWSELRDTIARDVISRGWNEAKRSYCATYDDGEPDASALCVGLSGLLPPDDPRFVATIDFVERHLLERCTVFRYHYDDGLPGTEGGFHLCTSWLIEAYACVGRLADAKSLFEGFLGCLGPTGLMAEEYDPAGRGGLGNYPQLYSHVGLINAALCVDRGS